VSRRGPSSGQYLKKALLTKCDVSICHAACCGPVPFTKAQFNGNRHLLQRKVEVQEFIGGTVVAVDDKLVCGFLTSDYRCAIYDNRPEVCRAFARRGETHPMLKCREFLVDGVTE
jgi:Fe-S-cluster containining protein